MLQEKNKKIDTSVIYSSLSSHIHLSCFMSSVIYFCYWPTVIDATFLSPYRICPALCSPDRQNSQRCGCANRLSAQRGVHGSSAGQHIHKRLSEQHSQLQILWQEGTNAHKSPGSTSSFQSAGGAKWTLVQLLSTLIAQDFKKGKWYLLCWGV